MSLFNFFRRKDNRRMVENCIFCKIITGEAPGDITYQDEKVIIFKDIKPATKFHYLACPKEHILNANTLTIADKDLLEMLVEKGKHVLAENGGDVNDVLLGFHMPPFNSVDHLHLHVISPASELSYLGGVVFKPNSWWFASVDQILEKITSKL